MADDTQVGKRVLFDPATLERAQDAAKERGMSLNRLIGLAVEHLCDRLLPADEVVWTRDVTVPSGDVHVHGGFRSTDLGTEPA